MELSSGEIYAFEVKPQPRTKPINSAASHIETNWETDSLAVSSLAQPHRGTASRINYGACQYRRCGLFKLVTLIPTGVPVERNPHMLPRTSLSTPLPLRESEIDQSWRYTSWRAQQQAAIFSTRACKQHSSRSDVHGVSGQAKWTRLHNSCRCGNIHGVHGCSFSPELGHCRGTHECGCRGQS